MATHKMAAVQRLAGDSAKANTTWTSNVGWLSGEVGDTGEDPSYAIKMEPAVLS